MDTDNQLTQSEVIYPHQPPKACDWKSCLSKMANHMSWTFHSMSQMFNHWHANDPLHTNICSFGKAYLGVLHHASSINSGWVKIVYLFILFAMSQVLCMCPHKSCQYGGHSATWPITITTLLTDVRKILSDYNSDNTSDAYDSTVNDNT